MTDFDLRKATHAVMDETDLSSPDEVADKVMAMIPTGRVRAILRQLLRDWVRVEFGRRRMASPSPIRSASPSPAPSLNGRKPKQTANPSAKVRAIREAAPRWLRDRVFVGNHNYKLVQDCTLLDVQFLRAATKERIGREQSTERKWAWAEAEMVRHRVARLGDLPVTVLDGWRDAA